MLRLLTELFEFPHWHLKIILITLRLNYCHLQCPNCLHGCHQQMIFSDRQATLNPISYSFMLKSVGVRKAIPTFISIVTDPPFELYCLNRYLLMAMDQCVSLRAIWSSISIINIDCTHHPSQQRSTKKRNTKIIQWLVDLAGMNPCSAVNTVSPVD